MCCCWIASLVLLTMSGVSVCRADADADATALAAMRQQAEAASKDNPAEAIAQIQKFQAQHPAIEPTSLA